MRTAPYLYLAGLLPTMTTPDVAALVTRVSGMPITGLQRTTATSCFVDFSSGRDAARAAMALDGLELDAGRHVAAS